MNPIRGHVLITGNPKFITLDLSNAVFLSLSVVQKLFVMCQNRRNSNTLSSGYLFSKNCKNAEIKIWSRIDLIRIGSQ